jgi:hypothetical protein
VLGVGFVVLVLLFCLCVVVFSDWRAASSLGDILAGALGTGVVVLCHCWCSCLVGVVVLGLGDFCGGVLPSGC